MLASLSLDLDNQWSYMKTHGDAGWDSHPSYLNVVIPRFLALLKRHDIRITVFVVGQDAALEKNHDVLRSIPAAGHEVGNHSFHHEPWFHKYTRAEVTSEISRAEDAIEGATGIHTDGYRAPGYSLTKTTLDVLLERRYRYDASTFPTFIGPLARAYYFMHSALSSEEQEDRDELFGGMRDGLRPVTAYRWRLGGGDLLEIPVTTLPVAKIPIHASYVQYLAVASPALARTYFRTAMAACRALRVEPSILLHPLDFLGAEDVPELAFFPAMGQPAEPKLELMDGLFSELRKGFDVVPVGEHARDLEARSLSSRKPRLPDGPT